MKITTHIDQALLARAMRAIKAHSQREALEAGLRQLIMETERHRFVEEFSRYKLSWSPQKLSRSRA